MRSCTEETSAQNLRSLPDLEGNRISRYLDFDLFMVSCHREEARDVIFNVLRIDLVEVRVKVHGRTQACQSAVVVVPPSPLHISRIDLFSNREVMQQSSSCSLRLFEMLLYQAVCVSRASRLDVLVQVRCHFDPDRVDELSEVFEGFFKSIELPWLRPLIVEVRQLSVGLDHLEVVSQWACVVRPFEHIWFALELLFAVGPPDGVEIFGSFQRLENFFFESSNFLSVGEKSSSLLWERWDVIYNHCSNSIVSVSFFDFRIQRLWLLQDLLEINLNHVHGC
mmetsp:Transcript_40766/g.46721  ORF Transcript_40766/g.46721 Transcript_40766/m.46721 type:complete len:280 (+) Transcript_40766:290-1129(+)